MMSVSHPSTLLDSRTGAVEEASPELFVQNKKLGEKDLFNGQICWIEGTVKVSF